MFEEKTNEELDRMAAEAQGWKLIPRPEEPGDEYLDSESLLFMIWEGRPQRPHYSPEPAEWYKPSKDINQASEFEEFVIGKVGVKAWMTAFMSLVPNGKTGYDGCEAMVRADARTRVIACLLALKEIDGEGREG